MDDDSIRRDQLGLVPHSVVKALRVSTFCTHGAIVKVVAGDPQSEAVFGYFYPADGGAGEE